MIIGDDMALFGNEETRTLAKAFAWPLLVLWRDQAKLLEKPFAVELEPGDVVFDGLRDVVDGDEEGPLEGVTVGDWDGDMVGELVGVDVEGDWDGETEGELDGDDVVGELVGDSVGENVRNV